MTDSPPKIIPVLPLPHEFLDDDGKFKVGNPGQKKGTVRKKDMALRKALEGRGFDLLDKYLEALGRMRDPEKITKACASLFPYFWPKLSQLTVETKSPEQSALENMSDKEVYEKVKATFTKTIINMALEGDDENDSENREGNSTTIHQPECGTGGSDPAACAIETTEAELVDPDMDTSSGGTKAGGDRRCASATTQGDGRCEEKGSSEAGGYWGSNGPGTFRTKA